MRKIALRLPELMTLPLRGVRNFVRALPYYGEGRICPLCGKSAKRFRPSGEIPRKEAQCVHCGALERHRLLWIYLIRRTNLFNNTPKKMLHIAPEECLESKFKQHLHDNYVTADLFNPRAMVKMDISNIEYPDQSFDVIYCSHVFEHVQDDIKAMREFYRVLANDGWAILLVPITANKTIEDPSITDPIDRLKIFGQKDHVRKYGPDYVDRLHEAGFNVKVTIADDFIKMDDALRMGLRGRIYYCTKRLTQKK